MEKSVFDAFKPLAYFLHCLGVTTFAADSGHAPSQKRLKMIRKWFRVALNVCLRLGCSRRSIFHKKNLYE